MLYRLYVALGAISLAACHQIPNPSPVPPDASDAAPPAPAADASPSTPCQAACDAMARVCGTQQTDCVTVMANIDGRRLVRKSNGQPLTCADVSAAPDRPSMRGLGIGCP